MVPTGGGSIVNFTSVAGINGEQLAPLPYTAAKAGVHMVSKVLAIDYARQGVRVNQINPGWVLTENEIARKREHGMDDDWFTKLPVAFAPSGRILKPEEIAASVVHFLSDDLGPVSGTVLELEQYPLIGRNPEKV